VTPLCVAVNTSLDALNESVACSFLSCSEDTVAALRLQDMAVNLGTTRLSLADPEDAFLYFFLAFLKT
jgi:hypothetical protein